VLTRLVFVALGNGAFTMNIQNISGIAKSEPIGIAFAILKVGP
jgi:hypothetical protein